MSINNTRSGNAVVVEATAPRTLRIATWNMAYWQHKQLHQEAWDFYKSIDADILLFQEGRPLESEQTDHIVWNEIGGRRDWGSGIFCPHFVITEETVPTLMKGVFTIGNIQYHDTRLTLISLYGLMESSGPTKGYSIPNLHRILSDLTGLFNGHIDGKRHILMGGDLNASTQFDKLQRNRSHEIFLERVDDFGLRDVFKLAGRTDHVQTLRHHSSDAPWQNDYLFIEKRLAKQFVRYEVIDTPEVRKFSDHNIVIAELSM